MAVDRRDYTEVRQLVTHAALSVITPIYVNKDPLLYTRSLGNAKHRIGTIALDTWQVILFVFKEV